MKRVVVLCIGILVFALIPAVVPAQGLLPNIPLLGGVFRGPTSCGEGTPSLGLGPLVGYVGWMPYTTRGVGFGVGGSLGQFDQNYGLSGVWFGAQDTCLLSNWLGFMASGWYLVPSNATSTEVYNNGLFGARPWDTSTEWWYVDGALLINGPHCLSLILGLRYDYHNTQFSYTTTASTTIDGDRVIFGLPTDQATVTSEGWIPLIGTQVAYSGPTTDLTVRVVGFPALPGNIEYRETLGALGNLLGGGGAGNADFSGTYFNGYFLEVFADYTRKFGAGGIGAFARWNMTHGNSNADIALPIGTASYALGFNRTSWTFGGSVSLSFNSPF